MILINIIFKVIISASAYLPRRCLSKSIYFNSSESNHIALVVWNVN